MSKNNARGQKIYHSMAEIEKDFFPSLYEERMERKRESESPEETGTRIVSEILEAIREELNK